MSSVSRNTRSQANPPPPNQKTPNTIAKVSGTDTATPRQEAADKAVAERETAIEKLVDLEAQIAANRAANLRSLARPPPNDGQTGQIDSATDPGGFGRGCGQVRGGLRGAGRGSGGTRGRGVGGRGCGTNNGPGQVAARNRGQPAGVSEQCEYGALHVLLEPETHRS